MSDIGNIIIGVFVVVGFFSFVCGCFYLIFRGCNQSARNRKFEAEEKARRYHQSIIDGGGRYDPLSDTYYNYYGFVMFESVSVGNGMAILGIVQKKLRLKIILCCCTNSIATIYHHF